MTKKHLILPYITCLADGVIKNYCQKCHTAISHVWHSISWLIIRLVNETAAGKTTGQQIEKQTGSCSEVFSKVRV
jgi:hypothetical protein